MSERGVRVLLLEDSVGDAELASRALAGTGIAAVTERVDTEPAFALALRDFAPHVILSDHALAQFNAPAALQLTRALRPGTPLIVVAGRSTSRSPWPVSWPAPRT